MKNYYRMMLGRQSSHAEECLTGGFIGTDFGIAIDLFGQLPEDWRVFNRKFIPIYLQSNPEKSKIAAGLACGAIWTVSRGMLEGDIVLAPDGTGQYRVGEVAGPYYYAQGQILPHRRRVTWSTSTVERADMSDALRNSCGSIGTVSRITKHAEEIEHLIGGQIAPQITVSDESIEDPSTFALEKHLEEFLVSNWPSTSLAREFDIFSEDGELVGQQFPTDTGNIDILAVSKDKKRLLVIELKKGRTSDAVVGQILRYMGYVQEELAEPGQSVQGAVIALEDDQRLKRALSMAPMVKFYRYEITFRLL